MYSPIKYSKMYAISITILLTTCVNYISGQDPIVQTANGQVQGIETTESFAGGTFQLTRFLGVPYAKPPVGSLRFMNPTPADPWQGILNATQAGASCYGLGLSAGSTTDPGLKFLMQPYRVSEDCLTVNVYYPGQVADMGSGAAKAVMVFIHGGGYSLGNGGLCINNYFFPY